MPDQEDVPGGVTLARWDPARAALVGPDGRDISDTQDRKAHAYITGGHITFVGTTRRGDATGGIFRLDPLRGSRQPRHVAVLNRTLRNGQEDRFMECDCQAFRGTARAKPRACSHVLAVARYLRAQVVGL